MKLPILLIIFSVVLTGCVPSLGGNKDKVVQGEFLEGKIVEGFPALPLYKNAKVIESYTDRGTWGASFMSGDKLVDVVNFYGSAFQQLGWESQLTQNSETNYQFNIKNAVHEGEVIVNTADDGKKTAIAVFVELR